MNVIFWNGGIKIGVLSRYVGPYKVSYWLRKHGYTSQVIDFVNAWQEQNLYKLTNHFIDSETKILAISTTFLGIHSYEWADGSTQTLPESVINVAKRIKEENPNIKIVMGGYKADLLSGFGVVDCSVMSYTTASEDIFLEYLEHLVKDSQAPVGRLIFPKLGKGEKSKSRMLYDSARNPTYSIENDDFQFSEQDGILLGEPLPLDVSRGCIFACRFCQYPHLGKGKLDYIRGMSYLEQEIRNNYEKFGTTNYYILDDTFNDTESKMQAFYDMTQRLPFKISYTSYLRADLIDRFPNTAFLLKESGCFGAYHGIESMHPEASKLVGKAWSGKKAKEFLPKLYHDTWKKEVPQHLNYIAGITGDTVQNVNESVEWFKSNDMHSMHYGYLGLFGTNNDDSRYTVQSEFDKNAEKYGYTFIEPFNGSSRSWVNDNWTTAIAKQVAEEANNKIAAAGRRLHVWCLPGLEWYGYSKETLRSIKRADVPLGQDFILDTTKIKQGQYFQLLLKL